LQEVDELGLFEVQLVPDGASVELGFKFGDREGRGLHRERKREGAEEKRREGEWHWSESGGGRGRETESELEIEMKGEVLPTRRSLCSKKIEFHRRA